MKVSKSSGLGDLILTWPLYLFKRSVNSILTTICLLEICCQKGTLPSSQNVLGVSNTLFTFLAHLCTKCSDWAFVTTRRSSVRECIYFFIQTTSPLKPLIGFWPYFIWMIPRCFSTKVVQTVLVGCISRSQGQKIGFQNAIWKHLVWNTRPRAFIFSI